MYSAGLVVLIKTASRRGPTNRDGKKLTRSDAAYQASQGMLVNLLKQ